MQQEPLISVKDLETIIRKHKVEFLDFGCSFGNSLLDVGEE